MAEQNKFKGFFDDLEPDAPQQPQYKPGQFKGFFDDLAEPKDDYPQAKNWEPSFSETVQGWFSPNKERASNERVMRDIAQRDGVSLDSAYRSVGGNRPMLNPEGRNSALALGQGVGEVVNQAPDIIPSIGNTALRSVRGGRESVTDDSWLDRAITSTDVPPDPNADPNYSNLQGLGKSMGYSLTTMGASLGAGAATTAATANPVAGFVAGMGTSGAVSFRGSKDEFLDNALKKMNTESLRANGRTITQREWDDAHEKLNAAANKYGAFEAIPEAISNAVLIGTVTKGLKGLALGQGSEQVTETITGVGQNQAEYDVGLTDELLGIDDVWRKHALQTAIMSGGMQAAGSGINAARNAFKKEDKPEETENIYTPPLALASKPQPHPDDVYYVNADGQAIAGTAPSQNRIVSPSIYRTGVNGQTPPPTPPNAGGTAPGTENIYADQPTQQGGLDMAAVVERMIGAESAGKANAKNPYSSAEGLGQFIDSTWLSMIRQHRPDVANGKSDAEILALKTNGALSREMTTRYAEDNMRELQKSGIEANGRNVYLAHHFGIGGARQLLRADPNAPVSSVVSGQVIAQNPYMKGKTVGQVLNTIARKMGDKSGAVSVGAESSVQPTDINATANPAIPDPELTQTAPDVPQEDIPAVTGNAGKVRSEDGQWHETDYQVIEADALQSTTDRADNQYRDRNRVGLTEQVRKIADDLQYDLVGQSPVMEFGAPVVGRDGAVIAGNGRLAGIQQAYAGNQAEDYKARLSADAANLGIDPAQLQGMRNPVLIRRLRGSVDTRKLATMSNEGGSARMSPLEQARVDAERIGSLAGFQPDDSGNITPQGSRGLLRQLLARTPQNQHNALQDANGMISQEGMRRIQNAVLHMAYGDSPALSRLVENVDNDSRNVLRALNGAAPALAEMRDSIRAGGVHNADIVPQLVGAVEIFTRLKSRGVNVQEWLNQLDAFNETPPQIKQLLTFLDNNTRRPNAIRDMLVSYANLLKGYGAPNQGDMFGASPPTTQEVLNRATQETEGQPQTDLFSGTGTGGQASNNRPDQQPQAEPATGAGVNAGNQGQGVNAGLDGSRSVGAQTQSAVSGADVKESRGVSTGTGQTVATLRAELRQKLGKRLDMLERSGKLVISDNPPADGVAGSFSDGVVTLYPDNIQPEQAWGVFLHEAGEHAGLQTMLGKQYQAVVDMFGKLLDSGNPYATRAAERVPTDTNPAHVDSERLAYLIEDVTNSPNQEGSGKARLLVNRIIAAVRAWAFANLPAWAQPKNLTPQDIQALAVMAARSWARGASSQKSGNMSESGVMRSENADSENDISEEAQAQYSIASNIAQAINSPSKQRSRDGWLQTGRVILNQLVIAPHEAIRDIGTPSALKLADLLRRSLDSSKHAITGALDDLNVASYAREGEFSKKLEAILNPLRKTRAGLTLTKIVMSKKDRADLVRGLHTGIVPVRLAPAARQLRAWLDEVRDYQLAAGLDFGLVKNYFPRNYDTTKVLDNQPAFIAMLMKNGYSRDYAETILARIVNGDSMPEMQQNASNRIIVAANGQTGTFQQREGGTAGSAGKSGHQQGRVLDIPYDELAPFLDNNLEAVLTRYLGNAIKRAEYARAYGANEGVLNKLVSDMVDEMETMPSDVKGRLNARQAVELAYDVADMQQGAFGNPKTAVGGMLTRTMLNMQVMIKLPLAVLSSLPEFITPALLSGNTTGWLAALVQGVGSGVYEGIRALDHAITKTHHLPQSEMYQFAEDIGVNTHAAIQDAIDSMYWAGDSSTDILSVGVRKFMRLTMQEQTMRLQKAIATKTFLGSVRRWAKNTGNKHHARMLSDFGIDPVQADAWAKAGFPAGDPIQFAINRGAIRFATSAITTPDRSNRSRMFQYRAFGVPLMLQFSSFSNAFGNTMIPAIAKQFSRTFDNKDEAIHTLKMIAFMVAMMGVAFAAQELRDWWKFGDKKPYKDDTQNDPMRRVYNSFDRAGFTGMFSKGFELVSPYKFGYGQQGAARFAGLLGPAVGDAGKFIDAFLVEQATPKKQAEMEAKFIVNEMPLVNALPYQVKKDNFIDPMARALR